MKKHLFAVSLLIFCLVGANYAQKSGDGKQFELEGVVKDKNSAVFAGVPLFFKSGDEEETSVSTDVNGEFTIRLSPGKYEVTVRKTLSENFKAHIVIQENGLNPNNVEFVVEPNPACCGTLSEKPYPKITRLPKPPYPAAARAVRAMGEVVVEVKINKEGKVISANAVSGHPLLRAFSAEAAQEALFDPSTEDELLREVKLTFVFLLTRNEAENVKRYSNLYRVEVFDRFEIVLDTTVNE